MTSEKSYATEARLPWSAGAGEWFRVGGDGRIHLPDGTWEWDPGAMHWTDCPGHGGGDG